MFFPFLLDVGLFVIKEPNSFQNINQCVYRDIICGYTGKDNGNDQPLSITQANRSAADILSEFPDHFKQDAATSTEDLCKQIFTFKASNYVVFFSRNLVNVKYDWILV